MAAIKDTGCFMRLDQFPFKCSDLIHNTLGSFHNLNGTFFYKTFQQGDKLRGCTRKQYVILPRVELSAFATSRRLLYLSKIGETCKS